MKLATIMIKTDVRDNIKFNFKIDNGLSSRFRYMIHPYSEAFLKNEYTLKVAFLKRIPCRAKP